jgi:hypothetical protein
MACRLASTATMLLLVAVSAAHAAPAPNLDPCKLLTDAEVRAVFPGATTGVRNRTVDEYGIVSCEWKHPGGRFAIQAFTSSEAPESEARGFAAGFLDPTKNGLQQKLRVERIAAGDGGVAIIERADATTGVLNDAALAIVKRGALLLMLQSSALAQRPRAEAVKAMGTLAAEAVKRVP